MDLQRQIRQVLAELELISHGSTQSWNKSGGGESDAVMPPGESSPPHSYWRQRFLNAPSHTHPAMLEAAREELVAWRQRTTPPVVEQADALAARIIEEGQGWSVTDVARSFRCTVTFVRKVRMLHAVDQADGKPNGNEPPSDLQAQVIELAGRGLSERQINMITGAAKSTVRRMLGRAA